MDFLVRALVSSDVALKPEAKYLLVRLIQQFGVHQEIRCTVKGLAACFAVSNAHISAAISQLVVAGVIVRRSRPQGRGRPIGCYEFSNSFRDKLDSEDFSSNCHQKAIERVLQHENRILYVPDAEGIPVHLLRMWAARKPSQLDVESRLLLAVLLCHADQLGVVRGQGRAVLMNQAGLSLDQMNHRVRSLVSQGLLRAFEPGSNGVLPFGRTTSAYFINLDHEELLTSLTPRVFVHIAAPDSDFGDHASFILHSEHHREERAHWGIGALFPVSKQRRGVQLLRSKLNEYASFLLSNCWNELFGSELHEGLLAVIRNDLPLSGAIDEPVVGTRHVATSRDRLACYIHDESLQIARVVQRSLMRASFSAELDGSGFSILQVSAEAQFAPLSIAVLVAFRGGSEPVLSEK